MSSMPCESKRVRCTCLGKLHVGEVAITRKALLFESNSTVHAIPLNTPETWKRGHRDPLLGCLVSNLALLSLAHEPKTCESLVKRMATALRVPHRTSGVKSSQATSMCGVRRCSIEGVWTAWSAGVFQWGCAHRSACVGCWSAAWQLRGAKVVISSVRMILRLGPGECGLERLRYHR
jgi:hypothetical protein